MLQRLLFGGAGLIVCALVGWGLRAGWYPARGQRIYRKTEPRAFWTVMILGAVFGGIFVLVGLLL
jgi:hypothetical protein